MFSTIKITVALVLGIIAIPFAGVLMYDHFNASNLPYLGPEDHVVPDFSFIDQKGNEVHREDYKGKIFVADFFFTRCPSICLKMTSELKRVQDKYSDNPELKLISFTVDPERDDPKSLANYASQFGADYDQWKMVTGDKKELYKLARNGFFITAVEGDGGEEDFIHSEKLALIDREGKIRGYYDGTKPESVDELMKHIKVLLKKN